MSSRQRGTELSPLRLAGVVFAIAALIALSGVAVEIPGALLSFIDVAIILLTYVLLVLGLNLQFGHTGLVNFGHVAFFAVGAYAVAMMTAVDPYAGIGLGYPWWIGLVAGVLLSCVLGVIIGVSTLRLRDDFLAIATLAAAEILHALFIAFESIFGATSGIVGIPQPIKEVTAGGDSEVIVVLFAFTGLALVSYKAVNNLTTAPYGRVLRAIRADELVTRALGKPSITYKMQAFVYGAALAGFAGGIFALYRGAVSPGFFTLNVTVIVWIGMLLGGPGNDRGVVAGLALIIGLRFLTRFLNDPLPVNAADFAALRLMFIGAILIVVIRYRPEGLFGNAQELGVDR